MKRTRFTAIILSAVLAITPAAPVMAEATTTETVQSQDGWNGLYYIKNGKKVNGLQKIGNKQYYFKSYKLVKNRRAFKLKVNGKYGYYNIDKKGVVTKWTGNNELAAKRLVALKANLNTVTSSKLKSSLKKAFLWSANLKYYNNTESYTGSKAAKYYGNYGFKYLRGDCNTQAYTFYYMAKVLGYNAKVVKGYIPTSVVNGVYGGFKPHAWVEITIGKTTYVCDPNFNTSSDAKSFKAKNTYVGFLFKYGAKNTYAYHSAKKKLLK